jgi:hypothetical protein
MRSAEECLAKAAEFSDFAERFEGRTRDTLLFIARTWRGEAERGEQTAGQLAETARPQ